MLNKNRSRDGTAYLKSCKSRSIETKQQQSTMRPSPKSTRYTKTSTKSKPKNSSLKSVGKLNQYINKITQKIQSFEQESSLVTLRSSTQPSSCLQSERNKKDQSIKLNIQTQILLEQMQYCRKQVSYQKQQKVESELISDQSYNKLFDKALSRPHCLKKIGLKRKNIGHSFQSRETINEIRQEIKYFKKEQNKNWKQINLQLDKFLNSAQKDVKGKDMKNKYKQIEKILQKQGKNNYRWIQIEQKLFHQPEFNSLSLENESDSSVQQVTILLSKQEKKQVENETQKKTLKNYNWEKYIWNNNEDQKSSSSELMCNSERNSQLSQVQIKTSDFMIEVEGIQQNVDLILNIIIDQFVMELALKLDFNFIKFKQIKEGNGEDLQYYENRQAFNNSIKQVAEDCAKIRSMNLQPKSIYVEALQQMLEYYPQCNIDEAKQKLCKYICNRSIEVIQILGVTAKEEQQWCKITVISELEQLIWQALLFEQVCRLWSK